MAPSGHVPKLRRRGTPADEPTRNALNQWLAKARRADLADSIGISDSALGKVLRGEDVDPGTLDKVRAFLAGSGGNIPHPLTELVGREEAVEAVRSLLAARRLVTLTGPGGIGKTELALRVARDVQVARGEEGDYPGGRWLVRLEALRGPDTPRGLDAVTRAVAAALGVAEERGVPLLGTLVRHLQPPRRLLLVLDNCEHLADSCATLAGELLRSCPGVRVLATSRERLRVRGEAAWPVPPLRLPPLDPPPSAGELARYAAARLFLEDPLNASDGTVLTETDAAAVARVCRLLDGIPLALRLASARVHGGVLSLGQLEQKLEQYPLGVLAGGDRGDPERQKTMGACIEWSYDLLSEEEGGPAAALLLRRLSVFRGGWTLEAAEAVCAGGGIQARDVFDLLDRLARASLVEREAAPAGPEAEPRRARRYRLLEVVRQYARERLAETGEGEREAVRARHCEFFTGLARDAGPHLRGRDQVAWLDRLEADRANFQAALEWLRAAGGVGESELRLCSLLTPFWCKRGHTREGLLWMRDVLGRTAVAGGEDGSAPGAFPEEAELERARALYHAATLANFQSAPGQALAFARAGLRMYEQHKRHKQDGQQEATLDPELEGRLRWQVAVLDTGMDEAEKRRQIRQARHLMRAAGLEGEADALIAVARRARGRLTEANAGRRPRWRALSLELERQASVLYEEVGNADRVARYWNEVGGWEWAADPARARGWCEKALELGREIASPRDIGEALWRLGLMDLRADDIPGALSRLEESVAVSRRLAEPLPLLRALASLGQVALARGEDGRAEDLFREGLRLGSQSGYPDSVADETCWCFEGLAMTAFVRGDQDRAAALLGVAWGRGREGPDNHDPSFPADYAPSLRERRYTPMRDALGADETRWHAARNLSRADALDFTLG